MKNSLLKYIKRGIEIPKNKNVYSAGTPMMIGFNMHIE